MGCGIRHALDLTPPFKLICPWHFSYVFFLLNRACSPRARACATHQGLRSGATSAREMGHEMWRPTSAAPPHHSNLASPQPFAYTIVPLQTTRSGACIFPVQQGLCSGSPSACKCKYPMGHSEWRDRFRIATSCKNAFVVSCGRIFYPYACIACGGLTI